MLCRKCKKQISDDSVFCSYCGIKQSKAAARSRTANGTGSAYKRGNTWTAIVRMDYYKDSDGKEHYTQRTKGGFTSRTAAIKYCAKLMERPEKNVKTTLDEIYKEWSERYLPKVSASTAAGYKSAYKHYASIQYKPVVNITANMLQDCVSKCPSGFRTKQMMKVVAGLLMKYAINSNLITHNPAENIDVGKGESKKRPPLSDEDLNKLKAVVDSEPYASYVICMSYLGFRPTEFFSIKKEDYHIEKDIKFFVSGEKTDAGKDRMVTIPPVIMPIIEKQLELPCEWVFPRYIDGGYQEMKEDYFRKWVFKPLLERLGIDGNKTPYSTRHTYSNKIKNINAPDRDKADLMGHADYETTKKFYQTSTLEDRKNITDQIV